MQIDLEGVETGGFPELDPGVYNLQVDVIKHEESSKGNPMLSWQFKITDGPQQGRIVFHRTVLIQKTRFALKQVLEALKPNESWDKSVDTAEIATQMIGEECRAFIGLRGYDGKTYPEIDTFYTDEKAVPSEQEEEDKEPVTAGASEDGEDADIPF